MKTGVLLMNLGTPSAPTPAAVRRYLREFLSDRNVVRLPRLLWYPVLYGFILPFRPARLAHAYRSIWTERGSPLLAVSQDQLHSLRALLGERSACALAMTYGEPGVPEALAQLRARQVSRVVLLPLYPQFSGTTTTAALEAVQAALDRSSWQPELVVVNDYHNNAEYIAALAESVRLHWQQHGQGHLLVSFHSIPQRYVAAGDPYQAQCEMTASMLVQALGLAPDRWSIAYQSRLGREPWLQPYTDQELPRLAAAGVREIDVICPGFSADCLETLEEVAIRYRQLFLASGGTRLRYIPALNAQPQHMRMLAGLVQSRL
ncbi:MAG TPA: ferrochelatase [Nevskiaceae bacterium]|nr:ferrochelatase [Nevskiaceae bacterium]